MSLDIAQTLGTALALHQAGRLNEAEGLYRQILAVDPNHADGLHLLGVIAHQAGHNEIAVDLIGRAIARNDRAADFHCNIGKALGALGRLDEAMAHFRQGISLNPRHAQSHNNLGNALMQQGRLEEAVGHFSQALAAHSSYAEAHYNLGNALMGLGRKSEATLEYQKSAKLRPGFAEAHYNLGNALRDQGRLAEAAVSYRQAIALKPNWSEAHNNLGTTLHDLDRLSEAEACYRQALAIDPRNALALDNLAAALRSAGRIDEAVSCLRRALAINPDAAVAHTNLIFALNFVPAATAADHQAERARWHEQHAQRFAGSIRAHTNDPRPDRRLRIGYVSSHFRHQAATFAFGGVIVCHDREQFEVICYSDTAEEDYITGQLRASADKWHDTAKLSDEELADLIRADGIDILVDLVGHMSGHRLLVFARKPAPIQVTAWGEPTGTGLETMDYLLSDPVLVPADERALLAEKVIDLPNFLGFWTPEPLPEPGPLPALARGYVTLGSFNRLDKIQDQVVLTWANILNRMPTARIVLKNRRFGDAPQRERIIALFTEHGVPPERIELLSAASRIDHFSAYGGVDIALDTFPHGGGMTTLDALWMGVPVVTLPGGTISSRLAAASLTAARLTDFIAGDLESYVELAVAKAADLPALADLRAALRARVAGSDFGDPVRYAHAVEAAFREMWRRWCASQVMTLSAQQALNQAATLHRAGRLAEAERLYRQILAINPRHADSLHLLGVIAHQCGRSDLAVDLIGKAIALNDRSANFHSNIGTALDALGRFEDAESHYERAIVLDPDHLDAHNNLGNTFFKRGKFAQAAAQFGRAVMVTPHDALAHFNLGNALLMQGDINAAIARYKRALFLKPGWAEPHYNLGRALLTQARLDEAAAQFRQALDCKPDYVEAYSELAAVLYQLGHLGEAQACARRALEIRPDDVNSFNVLGTSLLAMGRTEEAIDCFRRAVAAKSEYPALHSNLIFALNFDPTASAADQQAERAAWAERHASRFTGAIRAHGNDRDPQRRLRIGYVSNHFRRQAAICAFGGVIVNHDPDRFEVICYSDTTHEDGVTQRLVECADTWHRTAQLDDDALADLIRTDRIDILVDLVGHMRGHRLLVFARKPAPIQVTAWCEPNGTGLKTMDYIFADPVLVTPENRKLLAEEVIDLPNFLGLWLPQSVPEPKSLPARSRGRITFGSFNRPDKVQEPVLASWAAILRSVNGSRLVLKDRTLIDSSQQARILTAFAAHGVATERVTLLGWPNASEPYEAYQDIDLALDPFPHSGGMTTLEALWMGVPVVTCVGQTIPSRLTAASLSALGLTDFIAPDVEAYVKLAVAKARDMDGLARLRASLRKRVAGSDFGDPVRYARTVEDAYRKIWQRWCAVG